ncbi:hypothetical protein BOTNAR_0108g00300 [Botryotinia narcissicola]|uniref:Uncharacterized protein n=1 Tax=Botryotinia narcissicola TaxID=278944 RepID=A0A4Z1IN36_9HELO|nr:hypothetical protein BOTNAR_0108g00300 [Botryotinia narcissicola]
MGRSDSNERVAKPKKERKAKIPKDQRVRKPKLPKDKDPLRTNKPQVLLMYRSVHAKWGALFRKHLGLLEAHCKALDRVQQAMKSEMKNLSEEEKREWELNEEGPWRILCGLLDRGRDTLVSGRKMAQFVLPPRLMKDRKGLGVLGTSYEPLVPQLDARLAAEKNGTATTKTNESNKDSSDSSSDSSSSSDSDSDSDSDAAEVGGYEDEDVEMEDAPVAESKKDPSTSAPVETESSAHFFVDTEPTPIADLNKKDKKDKKRKADDALVGRKSKREKMSEEEEKEKEKKIEEEEVNFQAMEAQLQAEVEAGMKAQEEKAQNAEEKKEKKRKRDSNVEENEGKKEKKEKKSKKVEEEVKEAEEVEVEPEVEQAPEPEVESKKEKKSKKDKKRKADDVAAEDEQIDGKRKRKSK